MKQLILTIGLALVAGVIYAQSELQVQTTTTTIRTVAKTTLASEAAGTLMQNAVMESGTIYVQNGDTNQTVIITGMATIAVPKEAISQLVALPEGYAVSNIQSGVFYRATNGGYDVKITFVK